MSESTRIAASAATLTAEEVATCFRQGIPFTDLTILIAPAGESAGEATLKVAAALDQGAFIVWQLDLVCRALTIFPSWTHLDVVHADDELTMDELPLFCCRVDDFFQLLGFPPSPA